MRYLIRYGEISLKSRQVRGRLEELLECNILGLCEKNTIKAKATKARGRIILESRGPADSILEKCFGVVSFSQVLSSPPGIEEIEKIVKKAAISGIKKGESFKIDVNRAWKGFSLSTKKTEELLGSCVAGLTGAAVDLSNPDRTIYIEIGKKTAYIFTEKTAGPGGMPFGSAGKGILLLSGRNSAIAGWLMMKRGMEIIPLHVGVGKKEREQAEAHLGVLSSFVPEELRLLVFQCRQVSKSRYSRSRKGSVMKKAVSAW